MWMVNPVLMCRQHLLGEHKELHMMVGVLKKGYSIDGYVKKGLIDPSKIRDRHEVLVTEMERRGYNHQSPLPDDFPAPHHPTMSLKESRTDLVGRCEECANLHRALGRTDI